MSSKIMIAANETVICTKCNHQFPLDQGISRQTIERFETEFEQRLMAEKKELEQRAAVDAERKLKTQFTDKIAELTEALTKSQQAINNAKADTAAAIERAKAEASARTQFQYEQEKAALTAELESKNKSIQSFREQEMALRKQKSELEEQQANFQVEMTRRLDEERALISAKITQRESDRFTFMEAEYRKKIDDAQKANEDLRRKLEQGSQQLQGEVLELEIEQVLRQTFFQDVIEEVKKGQRGADVIQTVRTASAQTCGKIIWETKRAENWTDRWLQKLKDDQMEANADIAVLVTTVMPKGVTDSFTRVGDIWVVLPSVVRPVAETLRVTLLEMQRIKQLNTGRNEKMEQLFNYLSSSQFAQKVRTMVEGFEAMRNDLEAEKRAMLKIWSKRQTQIERVTGSMLSAVGELQAIAHEEMPLLDAIAPLDALALDEADA